jgi:hypothetical protein
MNHNGNQFAGIADIKSAYADGKITNPAMAKEKNSQGYETHKLRPEGTMSGGMQRSEETARKAHKKAGLKSEGNW